MVENLEFLWRVENRHYLHVRYTCGSSSLFLVRRHKMDVVQMTSWQLSSLMQDMKNNPDMFPVRVLNSILPILPVILAQEDAA